MCKCCFLILLSLVLLVGCTSNTSSTSDLDELVLENKVEIPTNIKVDKAADSEENELDEVEIITDDRVINDALHFLTLLKEKDIETLVQYWTSDNYNRIYKDIDVLKDNMVDMVQLYHEIIDFDSPLEVKLLNSEVSTVNSLQIINIKNREGFFVYDDGYYRDLVISYYDDTPSFSSGIYNYYPRAFEGMNAYIQAIKDEDKEKLVWLLTPDDVDFPYELTQQIINNYKKQLDVQSIKSEIIGWNSEKQFIVNTTDKNKNTHQFNIIFGDGLMGIRDDFIPNFDY